MLASAGLIAMTSGLIVMAASSVSPAQAEPADRVKVCKYVAAPEEGIAYFHHFITVAQSAVDDGSAFNDAQPSLVVGLDEACPPTIPLDDIPVGPTVTKADLCGTANDSYNVVADATKFTFLPTGTPASGSVSIAFTAVEGYVIQGPNPVVLTFTNVPCPVDLLEVKPAITMADPCGTAKDKVNGVAKTGYSFEVNGNKVKFTADEGYVLDGPSVLTAEFTNVACPEVAGTETATPKPSKTPDKEPTIRGTEAVPTAVAAGIGGNGPTMTGSSPIDLLAQMLVGGGLALLMAAGWLQIGRQTHGVHQV